MGRDGGQQRAGTVSPLAFFPSESVATHPVPTSFLVPHPALPELGTHAPRFLAPQLSPARRTAISRSA